MDDQQFKHEVLILSAKRKCAAFDCRVWLKARSKNLIAVEGPDGGISGVEGPFCPLCFVYIKACVEAEMQLAACDPPEPDPLD